MKSIMNVEEKDVDVAKWDAIDELTMDFVAKLKDIGLGGAGIPEGELLDVAKSVLEVVIPVVEEKTGEEFTYVDCDM